METKEMIKSDGSIANAHRFHMHELVTDTPLPHRLPSNEAADTDEPSDNEDTWLVHTSPDEYREDVVGISIGQEQLRMKSPETPAVEKAQALDQSKGYFDLDPDDNDADEDGTTPEAESESRRHAEGLDGLSDNTKEDAGPAHPPLAASTENAQRSEVSKSIMKDGLGTRTRRSSSGSSGVAGTLRRLLPDMPSMSFPKAPSLSSFGFGSKSKTEDQPIKPKRSRTLFSRSTTPWTSSTQSPDRGETGPQRTDEVAPLQRQRSLSASAGSADKPKAPLSKQSPSQSGEDMLSPRTTSSRRLLRRATSDNSLFMRTDLERSTTQEEAEKWSDVSEQINSRFKAITDSFQDSAIRRMPKMRNISLASFKPDFQRSNTDTVRRNTEYNVAATSPDADTNSAGTKNATTSQHHESKKHIHPILSQAVSELAGDVVVLGGYRGSILRSAKSPHKQLWVPVKVRIVLD
jgi:hypothetical protein